MLSDSLRTSRAFAAVIDMRNLAYSQHQAIVSKEAGEEI